MRPMICIDFGNSYTKIAIRRDWKDRSIILTDPSLNFDDMNLCVPTVVSRETIRGKESWRYGSDVTRVNGNAAGFNVFRNWKPYFFDGTQSSLRPAAKAPVLASKRSTAAPTNDKWAAVKDLLGLSDEQIAAMQSALGANGSALVPDPAPGREETDPDMKSLGLGFFKWLREFVRPFCVKNGLGPIEEIPTRVTLPSFGSVGGAELLLKEILEEAGWRMDETAATLAEPLANTIGRFTEGVNAVHRPETRHDVPNYGIMFKQTGMLDAMRVASLQDGPKSCWVLIADLGGYTLDFAMIALDLEDIDARISGTVSGKKRFAMHSEAIGVTTLDRRVAAVMTPDNQAIFRGVEAEPDQQLLESLHGIVYGQGRPMKLKRKTINQGAEAKRIRDCISEFADEVADFAGKFLDLHQYDHIDDLIFTGGGSMIPAVRDTLRKRLEEPYGIRKFHWYATESSDVRLHPFPYELSRGSTALGGASVYFDFATRTAPVAG